MSARGRAKRALVGEVCLYGNRDVGFGFIAVAAREDGTMGELLDGGFDAEHRLVPGTSHDTMTTCIYAAGDRLRSFVANRFPFAARLVRSVWVYEPTGIRRSLCDLDAMPNAGDLGSAGARGVLEPWSYAPTLVLSAANIANAGERGAR